MSQITSPCPAPAPRKAGAGVTENAPQCRVGGADAGCTDGEEGGHGWQAHRVESPAAASGAPCTGPLRNGNPRGEPNLGAALRGEGAVGAAVPGAGDGERTVRATTVANAPDRGRRRGSPACPPPTPGMGIFASAKRAVRRYQRSAVGRGPRLIRGGVRRWRAFTAAGVSSHPSTLGRGISRRATLPACAGCGWTWWRSRGEAGKARTRCARAVRRKAPRRLYADRSGIARRRVTRRHCWRRGGWRLLRRGWPSGRRSRRGVRHGARRLGRIPRRASRGLVPGAARRGRMGWVSERGRCRDCARARRPVTGQDSPCAREMP